MKYILMHREIAVAVLSINDISGTVYRVDDVLQPTHLPVGLYAADSKELAKNLNLWLSGRTIPASRSGFHRALEDLQVQKKLQLSANVLMMKCFALSLSDQYWLNPLTNFIYFAYLYRRISLLASLTNMPDRLIL